MNSRRASSYMQTKGAKVVFWDTCTALTFPFVFSPLLLGREWQCDSRMKRNCQISTVQEKNGRMEKGEDKRIAELIFHLLLRHVGFSTACIVSLFNFRHTANILTVLSTAFGSVTFLTVIWLYIAQSKTLSNLKLYSSMSVSVICTANGCNNHCQITVGNVTQPMTVNWL